eukprot:11478006-Alexandrium_andersonii.AAC.2
MALLGLDGCVIVAQALSQALGCLIARSCSATCLRANARTRELRQDLAQRTSLLFMRGAVCLSLAS